MKKKLRFRILSTTLFLVACISVRAQEFNFQYHEIEMEEPDSDFALSKHPFGAGFATKLQLMKEYYTTEEHSNISNTTSIVASKPAIYYSVIKTNKYLTKSAKKGQMSVEEAKSQLEDVLTKALNIRNQRTAELEKQLSKIKDPETIIGFYDKRIRLDR